MLFTCVIFCHRLFIPFGCANTNLRLPLLCALPDSCLI